MHFFFYILLLFVFFSIYTHYIHFFIKNKIDNYSLVTHAINALSKVLKHQFIRFRFRAIYRFRIILSKIFFSIFFIFYFFKYTYKATNYVMDGRYSNCVIWLLNLHGFNCWTKFVNSGSVCVLTATSISSLFFAVFERSENCFIFCFKLKNFSKFCFRNEHWYNHNWSVNGGNGKF